jgi:predicted glycosyltransferase
MTQVTLLVTHLLGSGHLSRSLTLARALGRKGFRPQLISGGMPTGHLDLSGMDFVQLPPVRSDGVRFTDLLDREGKAVTPDTMRERIAVLEQTLRANPPEVFVTELFPFGRRVLREEFLASLAVVEQLAAKPLTLASIRDILAPPSSPKKAEQTERWLEQHYDGILVHSDENVVPLGASWPVSPSFSDKLHYTGFIAPPVPAPADGNLPGAGEVLVTAGGGPVGRRLFEISIGAARLSDRFWRLLVGGADAPAVCAHLNALAGGGNALAEPLRADYRSMLSRCAAAVGQCGYNTAIDWLQAGTRGVFVPFAEAGEVEQTIRANTLGERFGYGVIAEVELTPENLAAATQAAIARGRFRPEGLRFDGAERSASLIAGLLEARL